MPGAPSSVLVAPSIDARNLSLLHQSGEVLLPLYVRDGPSFVRLLDGDFALMDPFACLEPLIPCFDFSI